ncbi:MAG: DUF1641 domain-containing protein [Myxococcales bacterium]|nr:DUF1641 domain-containing protein [Myxococcales bacterium]
MSSAPTEPDLLAAIEALNQRLDRLESKLDQVALPGLVERMDKFEAMVETLGTFSQRLPVLSEAAGHTASWAWDQAKANGVDPIAAGQQAAQLALAAAQPESMAIAQRLLAKRDTLVAVLDVLDEFDDEDLTETATAIAATRRSPAPQVGLFGALMRMGDPDVQRAVGFSLELARRIGRIVGKA